MRTVPAALAVSLVLTFAAACGKVGDPKPPIIRVPRQVMDLAASQSGNSVILRWTNPSRYVDDNAASDLGTVRILRNGAEIASTPAQGAGQLQSFEVDVTQDVGADLTFSIQLTVPAGRAASAFSNSALIRPVEVPGPPRSLTAVVDQFRVILTWQVTERNASLADVYILQRQDRPAPEIVRTTRHEDAMYEQGKTYTYTVTSARGQQGEVPGVGSATVSVSAVDKTPPQIPMGLTVESLGDQVVLRWRPNTERDFKDVLVFRSDRQEPLTTTAVDGFVDSSFRPGLSYQLAARDVFDNQSVRSVPQTVP